MAWTIAVRMLPKELASSAGTPLPCAGCSGEPAEFDDAVVAGAMACRERPAASGAVESLRSWSEVPLVRYRQNASWIYQSAVAAHKPRPNESSFQDGTRTLARLWWAQPTLPF